MGSFISPLTNRRGDEYGGSIENRLRFPLRVARAVRDVWPEDRPMCVSFTVDDCSPGGTTLEESIRIAEELKCVGCDLIHVLAGQTTADANPPYGRLWLAPFSDIVRNEVKAPTVLGGRISNADEVDTILAAGRADLCIVGTDWTAETPRLSFLEVVRR
jgi:anthraniloyl-CoA monooxygenase